MFRVKAEQIRLFQPEAEEAFGVRVMEYVREKHPDAVVQLPDNSCPVTELSDETFRELVRGGLRRAGNHGIEWKSTLLSFVVLMFIVAPNFDRHPKARKFFKNTPTVDDAAMESLMDEMTDEDWATIEKRYDARAWKLPAAEGVDV